MASHCLQAVPPFVTIVPSSLAALAAEEHGSATLASMLGAAPPLSWPPPLNGSVTRNWMRRLIAEHPDRAWFGTWYIVADGRLIGVCGCKGPPDADGTIELGYSVVSSEQGKGYATSPIAGLPRSIRHPLIQGWHR